MGFMIDVFMGIMNSRLTVIEVIIMDFPRNLIQ
jgi:hypothetical protein